LQPTLNASVEVTSGGDEAITGSLPAGGELKTCRVGRGPQHRLNRSSHEIVRSTTQRTRPSFDLSSIPRRAIRTLTPRRFR
jgi:hypothetical protein